MDNDEPQGPGWSIRETPSRNQETFFPPASASAQPPPFPPQAISQEAGTGSSYDVNRLIIEIAVNRNLFQKAVFRVTESTIEYGNWKVRIDDVSSITYWAVRTSSYGVPMSTSRTVMVHSQSGTKQIHFGAAAGSPKEMKQRHEAAWTAMLALSQKRIEPRLCASAFDMLQRGSPVDISTVKMTREGVSVRALSMQGFRKQYRWHQFGGARFERGKVVLNFRNPGQTYGKFIEIPMSEINSVLLPSLMTRCAQAFAS